MIESLPEEFAAQLKLQLGAQYNDFLQSLQQQPPVSIRINPKKYKGAVSNLVLWTNSGMYLEERPVFTLDPLFHAGTYYVQEASSMFLEQAVLQSIQTDIPIKALDLCAAPGGKSTHLVSLLHPGSLLVSNEVIKSRANILSENIQKWGYPNCVVTNNDPHDFQRMPGYFDLIVVDAPCSGEGLFRKDHHAIQEWSPQAVEICASRQKRILEDVWPALKEDGVLIYSTCTYNQSENEENLTWLQQTHDVEFVQLNIDPSWNIEPVSSKGILGYHFYPHRTRGEGFFLSVIRKKESSQRYPKTKSKLTPVSKKVNESIGSWINQPNEYLLFQHHELIYSFPEQYITDLDLLFHYLRVIYAGTNIATVKHDKFIPEHSLAVSTLLNVTEHHTVSIDHSTALQYLKREAIMLDDMQKGYALLLVGSVPIGWANVLQNRVNNMYPHEWRIRMAIHNH
jgi:16S rRNA C967 or C1407 C5-methylase (RsmB/RsmF family)/NOL1/NOP2/fmu family ribosome biogenesis protein